MPYFSTRSSPTKASAKYAAVHRYAALTKRKKDHVITDNPNGRLVAGKRAARQTAVNPNSGRCRLLRPRQISAAEIALENTLLDYLTPVLLPADNGIVSVQRVDPKAIHLQPYIAINFALNGKPSRLVLDKPFAKAFFAPFIATENLPDLPKALRLAVAEAVLDKALQHFAGHLGWNIEITAINPYRKRTTFYNWFFRIALNDVAQGLGFVELTPELSELIVQSLPHAPPQAASQPAVAEDYWSAIETEVNFIFSELELSATEYSLLSPGDVLLTGLPGLDEKIPVIVDVFPNYRSLAFLTDTTLTISSAPEINMQDYIADDAPIASDDINELGIKLTFDVGNRTVTLGELKQFKPGFSMELDRLVENPVRILANGKLFGHGQLIQVGKRIGVQITDIKHGNRTSQ